MAEQIEEVTVNLTNEKGAALLERPQKSIIIES